MVVDGALDSKDIAPEGWQQKMEDWDTLAANPVTHPPTITDAEVTPKGLYYTLMVMNTDEGIILSTLEAVKWSTDFARSCMDFIADVPNKPVRLWPAHPLLSPLCLKL